MECVHKKQINAYTLEEISRWQNELSPEKSAVQLPSLQRGFVWKPNQIEALWDSILRGYPVGAILMSVDKDAKNRFLLDGQQRCTSIALGFFNPLKSNENKQFLALKDYLPSIWIDLKPRTKSIGQKYVLRVLTKSHPWGYRIDRDKNGNGQTLTMSDRRNALKYFQTKQSDAKYIDLLPSNINPWDAYYPIPLSYLLDIKAGNEKDFISTFRDKVKDLKIQTKYSNGQDVSFEEVNETDLSMIYKGIASANEMQIPEIVVRAEVLKEDEDDNASNESENPTLFVRLNSAGTRIGGEELIYSIYKAAFPEAKELVEKIGANYIAPSKVINLISRLVSAEINEYKSFPKDFNITSFRKEIKTDAFKAKIQSYILESEAKKIIDTAIKILKQGKNDIPEVVIKQFIVSSPDLFLVLLLYIKKHNLHNSVLTETEDISSSYVYLLWFSLDNKKTPSNLFKHLAISNNQKSKWGNAVQNLLKENLVIPLLEPELLRENLINIVVKHKANFDRYSIIRERGLLCESVKKVLFPNSEINDEDLKNKWGNLIERIYRNKTILLYSQRAYINEKFKDFNQFESIEDTNRPWDWDHIYPNSWVYNKESINQMVKSWVNCIGNYRALSYDDNRSESNHKSPKERFELDNKKSESFIKKNDLIFWNKIDQSFGRIKHNDEEKSTIFLSAVIHRMINIYGEWYTNFNIERLFCIENGELNQKPTTILENE